MTAPSPALLRALTAARAKREERGAAGDGRVVAFVAPPSTPVDGVTESVATATHVFGAPGTYTVTATVTDNGGLTASKTTNVVVVAQGAGFTAHGFTIPTAHPRLWWTPAPCTQGP